MKPIKFYSKNFLICFILVLFSEFLCAQNNNQFELDKVEFRGNDFFSSSVLADVIVSKQTPNIVSKTVNHLYSKFGRAASIFDSLLIQYDLEALNYFYKDNGFFKTKFSCSYIINDDNKTATLLFNIKEGPQFIVRKHKLIGVDSLHPDLCSRLNEFRLDSAALFSKKVLDENNNLLISSLRDNGYMLAKIDPARVDIDTSFNFVNITVHVYPGIKYIIDTLRVVKRGQGKDEIEDNLITKIARIKPNESYSAYEKQRAQVRLYRTNLFSSVMISAIIKDTMNYHVPLTIAADIGTMQELSPELILNNKDNSFNLGFGAVYSKKNFMGNARNFMLSGNFAVQDFFKKGVLSNLPKFFTLGDTTMGYVDIRASLEQPYFFDEPITTKFESYWTENKKTEYQSFTIGGKLSFDFELPKYVFVSSLSAYYSIEGSIYNYHKNSIKELLKKNWKIEDSVAVKTINAINFDNSWESTSIIGTDIGINKTDNPLFPTKGYNLSFTFEEANLLLDLFNSVGIGTKPRSLFYKVQTSISVFPHIYNTNLSALGIKFKVGYLQTYAGQENLVPLNKRFTAGGSNSIRGWRARDPELMPAGSQDIVHTLQNLQTQNDISDLLFKDILLGGTFLLEGSFETRNRLYDNIGIATFIDYGNTWEGYKSFTFSKLAVAFGFGFRYYSAFAPFRVDFGLKAYDPNQKKNFFMLNGKKQFIRDFFDIVTIHLGIGEAF